MSVARATDKRWERFAHGADIGVRGFGQDRATAFAQAARGARRWHGRAVHDQLLARGILALSPSARGLAEEAPRAYTDVAAVVEATVQAGLARRVATLRPLICIKG